MKTNVEMLNELFEKFTPKEKHIVNINEIHFIRDSLNLLDRDLLDLRNLRDMTVLYFNMRMDNDSEHLLDIMDKLSAVTMVIDDCIIQTGGEV